MLGSQASVNGAIQNVCQHSWFSTTSGNLFIDNHTSAGLRWKVRSDALGRLRETLGACLSLWRFWQCKAVAMDLTQVWETIRKCHLKLALSSTHGTRHSPQASSRVWAGFYHLTYLYYVSWNNGSIGWKGPLFSHSFVQQSLDSPQGWRFLSRAASLLRCCPSKSEFPNIQPEHPCLYTTPLNLFTKHHLRWRKKETTERRARGCPHGVPDSGKDKESLKQMSIRSIEVKEPNKRTLA